MRPLQKLLTVLCLMFSLASGAQQLTGTWLGVYIRDEPLDKRYFYYRLFLQQRQDSLYGICEFLDAQTDVKAMNPKTAPGVALYKVFNHRLSQGGGRTAFEILWVRR